MNKSTILTVCLSISVGYILATSLDRTSAGQPPQPVPVGQEGQVWRYQLLATADSGSRVLLTDTLTGRVWWRLTNERVRRQLALMGVASVIAAGASPSIGSIDFRMHWKSRRAHTIL
jgi:hypothetical protein